MTPPVALRFATSATRHADLPARTVEVAFVGRSNVGKSSLINALTGVNGLARASNWFEPGMPPAPGWLRTITVGLPGRCFSRNGASERTYTSRPPPAPGITSSRSERISVSRVCNTPASLKLLAAALHDGLAVGHEHAVEVELQQRLERGVE